MTKTVTIYHTNDIHSGFATWPRIVSYIKRHRHPLMRYVDLGDHADRANPLTEATYGKGNIELLNEAGVDFAVPGNNEGVTFSKQMLYEMYEHASFQVLAANLIDQQTGTYPHWIKPYWIDEMEGGIRIGYIGYTASMIHFYEQLGWDVAFSIERLRQLAQQVAAKTDALVLLSHLGLPRDEQIAAEITEIDVIIGAHTHHALPYGKRISGKLIAQAGKHGQYLGKLSLEFAEGSHKFFSAEEELLDPRNFDEDPGARTLLQSLQTKAQAALSAPAAVLTRKLEVKWFEHSAGPQALCDELSAWCGAELGMLNAGVLLESLPEGPVTYGDLHRVCPHPINPCIVELTGAELTETIERAQTDDIVQLQLKGFGFRGEVLGTMVYTGIDVKPEGIFVCGKPIVAEHIYRLATLDMYTFGFLFPKIAEAKKKTYLLPEFLRDILLDMLKKWH